MKNKSIFTGKIRLLSGLHIGSGEMNYKTDATVMKDPFGYPFIPGSSIKGVLRTITERLHHIVLNRENYTKEICYLQDGEEGCNTKALREALDSLLSEENEVKIESKIEEWLKENLCPVCQLFGSTFKASKLTFYDAKLNNNYEIDKDSVTEIRHGIAIDRDTGTTKNGAKFDYEVVKADKTFDWKLEAENLNTIDRKLLMIALSELSSGKVHLGGKISRGLGLVKLEDTFVHTFDFSTEYGKKRYLDYLVKDDQSNKMFLSDWLLETNTLEIKNV